MTLATLLLFLCASMALTIAPGPDNIFMAQALVIFTLIGFFSGSVGGWLQRRPRAGLYFNWLAGGIFALLGLRLALAER